MNTHHDSHPLAVSRPQRRVALFLCSLVTIQTLSPLSLVSIPLAHAACGPGGCTPGGGGASIGGGFGGAPVGGGFGGVPTSGFGGGLPAGGGFGGLSTGGFGSGLGGGPAGGALTGGLLGGALGGQSGAFGGALGGALGSGLGGGAGNGSSLLFLVLLLSLLQQFMGSGGAGGSTPQRAAFEEQPARPPRVIQRRTGPRLGTPGTPGTPLQNQPVFLADGDRMFPEQVTLPKGQRAVTVFNTDDEVGNLTVRKTGQTTPATQKDIPAGSAQVFRFQSTGTFELFEGETRLGTVTVQ